MADPNHTLFVCTTCRSAGEKKAGVGTRSGQRLHDALRAQYARWAAREGFRIVGYECLSVCPRPCAVALRAPGKFTYVFGDMEPGRTEEALIECASLYRRSKIGFLPRDERPPSMRGSILSRIPPEDIE